MRKRIVLTCVLLALAAILALVYALVILPEPANPDETAATTAELLPGEVAGTNGRVQMFDHISSEQVDTLYIKNQNGEYRLVRDENKNLVIDGSEHLLIDQEKLVQMIVNAGYTLSTYSAAVTEADFEKYGLGGGNYNAYFVLRSTAGKRYTVYIGDRTLAGDGYYARYEGRDAIYILDDSIEKDLLASVNAIVRPLLAYPSSMNSYYLVQNFMLMRGEEMFLAASYLNPDMRDELAAMSVHQLQHPGAYPAGEYYDDVLTLFCDFKGTETVATDVSDATLAKYGLDKPAYTLYFENTTVDDDGNPTGTIPNYLAFSEKQQDASGAYYYYVASFNFGIIARMEQITLDFLEWDLDKWVSSNIFQVNIVNVSSLRFDMADLTVTFELTGKDNESLVVTERETGHKPEVKNFRQLWKVLLSITHDGTIDIPDADIAALTADESNLLLTLTVTTRAGKVREYKFYPYTDRRVYYTVNGEGEFYLSNTLLYKAIADAKRVMNDQPVDADSRY